ncbi:hypothetical protein D3C75_890240 [compost metagenome]
MMIFKMMLTMACSVSDVFSTISIAWVTLKFWIRNSARKMPVRRSPLDQTTRFRFTIARTSAAIPITAVNPRKPKEVRRTICSCLLIQSR